jgi:hypothetical protein
LSDEYSGFHWSSWQLGAHGGEQISTLPVVVIILHNQSNCLAYGTLGLDSLRPGKQLAGQPGWDSSCHTECRSPSLDRVRDLSLYEQRRGRSHHVAKNHENLIEPIKRINLTMPRSSEPTVKLRLGSAAHSKILYPRERKTPQFRAGI